MQIRLLFHIIKYKEMKRRFNVHNKKMTLNHVGDLLRAYKKFARVLQQRVKEGRLTKYERQVIRDMTVKVSDSRNAMN